jgi:hypothetical protein
MENFVKNEKIIGKDKEAFPLFTKAKTHFD